MSVRSSTPYFARKTTREPISGAEVIMSRNSGSEIKWAAITGLFSFKGPDLTFRPELLQKDPPIWGSGIAISSLYLAEGAAICDVEFPSVGEQSSCELILYYQPENRFSLLAGLGGGTAFQIRHFDGQQWVPHFFAGDKASLESNRPYHVVASRTGNSVS